jgi:hypothetical protein
MIDDGLYDNKTASRTVPLAPTLPALYSFGDTDVYPLAAVSKTTTMDSQSVMVYDNPKAAPHSTIVNVYDSGSDPTHLAHVTNSSVSPAPPPRTHSPAPSALSALQAPTTVDSETLVLSHYFQPQSSNTSLGSETESFYLQPATSAGTHYESLYPQAASSSAIRPPTLALPTLEDRPLLSPAMSSMAGTALTSLAPSPVPFSMAGQPQNAEHNYESLELQQAPRRLPQRSPQAESSYEYSDSEDVKSVRSMISSSLMAARGGQDTVGSPLPQQSDRQYSNPEGSEALVELAGSTTGKAQSTTGGLVSPTPHRAASSQGVPEYSNPEENEESAGRYESLTPQAVVQTNLIIGQRMVPVVRTASPLRNSLAPPQKVSPRPRSGSRPAPPSPPPPPPLTS